MRIHPNWDRHVATARRTQAAALATLLGILLGCGTETPVSVPADPALGVQAAGQAAAVQDVIEGRSAAAAVQAPFSNAAGDLESLGDVGLGADDLGEYGRVGKVLSSALGDLERAASVGAGVRRTTAVLGSRSRRDVVAVADSCITTPEPGGATLTVCIVPTGTPNVVRVTITRTSPIELVRRTVQVFEVDTNGTPAQTDDDRISRYHSQVTLRDGSTIDLEMSPQTGGAISDHAIVDVVEAWHPARGPVLQQTNAITLNVGLVATDGDETILTLAASVDYRNGAHGTLTLDDRDPEDGIADEDSLDVVAHFTAAPSNPWLQTVTSTVGLLVHQLANEADDEVFALGRTTVFDGQTAGGGAPTATTTFVPSTAVGRGEEPCGGHFERHAVFPVAWNRRSLDLVIDRVCEGGGTASLDVHFADDTTTQGTTTWDGSGNATSATHRRDGAVVTATFTAVDHHLAAETIYPLGHDPVSEQLDARHDPEAGTGDLLATRLHLDSSRDSLVAHSVANGDSTETLTGHGVDGRGRVDFTMQVDRRTGVVTGSSQGPDDESLTFTLAPQAEVEGWLLTCRFADPSADLVVMGAILLDADGSGCGTLTITSRGRTATVPVCFEADGGGTIVGTGGPIPF